METTKYGLAVKVTDSPSDAEARVRDALAGEGFGILTEIDVAATMKAKLDIDRAPYKILGACNPSLANEALGVDEEIGMLLPCNVVVYENHSGETVVAALDPGTMIHLADDPGLEPVATEARERIERAIRSLE